MEEGEIMANTYYYVDKVKFDNEQVVNIINISKIRLLNSHYLIADNLAYLYISDEKKLPFTKYSDYMIDPSGKLLVPSPTSGGKGEYGTNLDDFYKWMYFTDTLEEVIYTQELYNSVSRIAKLKREGVVENFDIVYRVHGNNQYKTVKSSKINITRLDDILTAFMQLRSYDITSDDSDNFDLDLEFTRVVTANYGPTWNDVRSQ